jgi:hypothetical protein
MSSGRPAAVHVLPIARRVIPTQELRVQAATLFPPGPFWHPEAKARWATADKSKTSEYGFEVVNEYTTVQDGSVFLRFPALCGECPTRFAARDGDIVMEKLRTTNSGGCDGTDCTFKVLFVLLLCLSLNLCLLARNRSVEWRGCRAIARTDRTSLIAQMLAAATRYCPC